MSAPAWKDAPDVAGLWLNDSHFAYFLTEKMLPDFADYDGNTTRYYGPIPEDKK